MIIYKLTAIFIWCGILLGFTSGNPSASEISVSGSASNDLCRALKGQNIRYRLYDSPSEAIASARKRSGVIIVADHYPDVRVSISDVDIKLAKEKKLRVYLEYPDAFPDMETASDPFVTDLERLVVAGEAFAPDLSPLTLLGINEGYILKADVRESLLVAAKVAGFDSAVYGIDDVKKYPVLWMRDNFMIAATKLSNFRTGRYEPTLSWKQLWENIISWAKGGTRFKFNSWNTDVSPSYTRQERLPGNARRQSVAKGVEWFYKGRFFIDSSWKSLSDQRQGDGTNPFGPPVGHHLPSGDGTWGILEGHASRIYHDGSQQYRYWIRADVQGEVSYAMALAGKFLGRREYYKVSQNLTDFIFENSNLRKEARGNKDSAVYGLIGWAVTHPYIFYADDNARAVLGVIGASAAMRSGKWDKEIVENIIANFRLSSKQGFQGMNLKQKDIQEKGWQYFANRDLVQPSPNFEAWMIACYLWLYDKTQHKPLLDKAKTALRLIMEAYPEKWQWSVDIQLERARMLLPLSWLVRVEDTEEHRQWLDKMASELLKFQDGCGGLRVELGKGNLGMSGKTTSNETYGKYEAPLIAEDGDRVCDMLYTNNFAFFGLNEAAKATGNPKYKAAVQKMSDFLTRIQVKSENHPDVDGAWFRAFDYGRWDYWASNADAGWGTWSTLTGWIQTWIVATQILIEQGDSFWDATKTSGVNQYFPQTLDLFFHKH